MIFQEWQTFNLMIPIPAFLGSIKYSYLVLTLEVDAGMTPGSLVPTEYSEYQLMKVETRNIVSVSRMSIISPYIGN